MGWDKNRFKVQPNSQLICGVCSQVFDDPVLVRNCEDIFCMKCITVWLENHETCPKDGGDARHHRPLDLEKDLLQVPKIVKSLLEGLEINCNFASIGCKEFMKVNELQDHVNGCPLNPDLERICDECETVSKRDNTEDEFPFHSCLSALLTVVREVKDENRLLRQSVDSLETQVASYLANFGVNLKADNCEIFEGFNSLIKSMIQEVPWLSSSKEQKQFINQLKRISVIKSEEVYKAMMSVELATFYHFNPYSESKALDIIERLEAIEVHVKKGMSVLVTHSLPLYVTTCLAIMLGPSGSLVAFLRDSNEFDLVFKDHCYLLDSERLTLMIQSDSSTPSHPSSAPFDLIIVNDENFDADLVKSQLKPNGVVFCPNTSLDDNVTDDVPLSGLLRRLEQPLEASARSSESVWRRNAEGDLVEDVD